MVLSFKPVSVIPAHRRRNASRMLNLEKIRFQKTIIAGQKYKKYLQIAKKIC